jgi:transposase
MADKEPLTALLRLRAPWYISRIDVDVAGEEAHVTIDHHPGKLPCAPCGKACLTEDHGDERVIRHLDMWQAKTFLHVAMPRTRCPDLGALRVALPFAEPGSRVSMAFEERTITTILACQTVQGASDLMCISWDEARVIMDRSVACGLGRREAEIVKYLGIDEKAISKGHRHVTILTNLDGRRILEVTPDKTQDSLVLALNSLNPEQIAGVSAFSVDRWESYRQAIDQAIPAPVPAVVHDRFHIVAHANKALNEVRKDEARSLAQEGRRDLNGLRQALLFAEESHSERHEASISALTASDPRTPKGYALKENLRHCWDHQPERTASRYFLSWIRLAKRSALRPFQKVGSMIVDRLDDIVSYFTHPITNAPQEGMNSKLMSVIRAGRGYRHHETFRMAALFLQGGLDLTPRYRHD